MAKVVLNKTKKIIAKLRKTTPIDETLTAAAEVGEIEKTELVRWINNRQQGNKKNEFLLESLSAALLKDLHDSLFPPALDKKKKISSWSNKLKYWLLGIAGIIFFGCEGFDGITAMLEVFSLTPVVILATGIAFSMLAITAFCAFDLVEIAKNLGIKNKNSPQLLDIYLKETKAINKIQQKILSKALFYSVEELRENLAIVQMLQARHAALNSARETMEHLGSRPALQMAKSITAVVAGIIFFSGGFFAGQTVALSIAELCFTAVSASFPPILLISFLVGTAAFGVYWYVERPGIENLIASYAGLDQEKIEEFCDKDIVSETTVRLNSLEAGFKTAITRMEQSQILQTTKVEQLSTQSSKRVFPAVNGGDVSLGKHAQAFHNQPGRKLPRSLSVGNLEDALRDFTPPPQQQVPALLVM